MRPAGLRFAREVDRTVWQHGDAAKPHAKAAITGSKPRYVCADTG